MDNSNLSKIPHKCLLNIKAVYDIIQSAEKKAVDFILSNPEEIENSTISEVAVKSGCSEATIVRVVKRLGYEGFPELKADFAKISEEDHYIEYEEIKESDDASKIVKKVFDSSIAAINDTFGIMNMSDFKKALELLLSANKIMFCGVGDASLVAEEAYQRFTRAGQNCYTSADYDIQLVLSSQLNRNDVLVAISYSGRSQSVIKIAKVTKKTGAKIIAITNFPISPLSKKSDIVLQTAVFSKYVTGEIISKRITELLLIEALYINFILKKGSSAMNKLKQSNETLKENKV
jgi:RpiR family transcriptional regulator, carbohydrate utilization regulator